MQTDWNKNGELNGMHAAVTRSTIVLGALYQVRIRVDVPEEEIAPFETAIAVRYKTPHCTTALIKIL